MNIVKSNVGSFAAVIVAVLLTVALVFSEGCTPSNVEIPATDVDLVEDAGVDGDADSCDEDVAEAVDAAGDVVEKGLRETCRDIAIVDGDASQGADAGEDAGK